MKLFRIGICALLAFGVLAFGGVEEWAQAVLEVGASILLVVWAIRLYRRRSEQLIIPPEFLPLVAFALVVIAQWVFQLTSSRYYTRMELQLLALYMIVIFLISQAYSRTSHWRGFLWFLMSLGFFVSIFGILQYVTSAPKLYWLRALRYGGVPFGPYVNRNHFAGFAEMVIPVALVPLVLGKVRRERVFLVGLFALVPIVALFLSASRGGIISLGVQLAVLCVLLLVHKVRGRNIMIGGIVLLCAIMMVSWIGVQQILSRFTPQSMEVSAQKRTAMREDTWRLFLDHPGIGTGLGTFEMVFPPYDSLYDGKIVNHAHNDYLEALAETGVVGGLACALFLGLVLINSMKGLAQPESSFGATLNITGLIGCVGILVHSLVDFNLHIPANALLFFVSAHMATARLQPAIPGVPNHRPERRRIRKQ